MAGKKIIDSYRRGLAGLEFSFEAMYCDAVPPCGSRREIAGIGNSLWLLTAGTLRLESAERSQLVRPDTWVLIPPGCRRSQLFSPDARMISLRFNLKYERTRQLFPDTGWHLFARAEFPRLEALSRELIALPRLTCYCSDDVGAPDAELPAAIRFDALSRVWLDEFCTVMSARGVLRLEPDPVEPRLAAALELLRREVTCGALPYDRMIKASGLGRVQFDRLFRRSLGVSPRMYADKLLLERACRLLSGTDQPCKNLCFELGFATLPHFSAWFRRHTGLSPRAFRRQPTA